MNTSHAALINAVEFHDFTGERVYMRRFTKEGGLPADLKRWQPTVDDMLRGINAPGDIFIMVDQSEVKAGQYHRRPGVHVDGYWHPEIQAHSGGGGRHNGSWKGGGWSQNDFSKPENLILASDVFACRAWVGHWQGEVKEGGDCSHIDRSNMFHMDMRPNFAYFGNVTMLHESLPVLKDCKRTLVRLNVKALQ